MLKVVQTENGFDVIDENGQPVNPKPFTTREEAEAFRMKMMQGGQAQEAGVPMPPPQMPPMPGGAGGMLAPPMDLAAMLGGK